MIIAFEGNNGSGKSSIIQGIYQQLQQMGEDPIVLKAPDYNGLHGQEIQQYLRGELQMENQKIDQLFKLNRLHLQKTQIEPCVQQNKIVLLDRFSVSAQVYSVLRGTPIEDTEYLTNLVQGELIPHITLFIDCDSETVYNRLQKRQLYQIYSHSLGLLNDTREIYRQILSFTNYICINNNMLLKTSINQAMYKVTDTMQQNKNKFTLIKEVPTHSEIFTQSV